MTDTTTAIDHRAEALRLLAVANDRHADADPEGGAIFTAQAQVHATLAVSDPHGELVAVRELARIEKERADRYVEQVLELQVQLNELVELRKAVAAFVRDEAAGTGTEYKRTLQALRTFVVD